MMFGASDTSTLLLIGTITVVCSVLATWSIRRLVKARTHSEPSMWSQTTGTIVMSAASAGGRPGGRRGSGPMTTRAVRAKHKSPEVVYAYSVGGHVYQGTRIRVEGSGRSVVPGTGGLATIERYPAGATVTVYYDPANPWDAALER